MHLRAPAILLVARTHGETAVIARMLTEQHGVVAGYVAGGRGRQLRPVVIPGNLVELQLSARSDSQLPFAKLELLESRGPWLGEPLPAAAIGWACALTATALPERQPYPSLYQALTGLLSAVCHAPSARGWATAMVGYEGHRGWINYLAVKPELQQQGLGRQIMDHAETLLRNLGCPKINLQVRTSNREVITFYERLGFVQDDVVSLGKRLVVD